MVWLSWFMVHAEAAPITDDVARGWYLWETGRDFAAAKLASDLAELHPDSIPVLALNAAMQVQASRGASVEAIYREAFSQYPDDQNARVALAYAITYRHPEAGPWCDEVYALIRPVVEGDAHAWATLAEREAELRCEGDADHANAELIRLSVNPSSPAWVDGVIARAESGYIRPEAADQLEQIWAMHPERLDRAAGLWAENTTGPARGKARRVTKKALVSAADSPRPTSVWAALQAYRALGEEEKATAAEVRLRRLDADAELGLARSRQQIGDPEIYQQIDECFARASQSEIRACASELPDTSGVGAVAAHLHYQRFLALRAFGEPDAAMLEAIAARQADPGPRSYARSVVVGSLDLETVDEATAAAVNEAVEYLLAEPPDLEGATRTRARRWARDLSLAGQVTERRGDPSKASHFYRKSFTLDPVAATRLRLGRSLADSQQLPSAVLHLAKGLVEAMDERTLIAAARGRLDALAPLWERSNANEVLAELVGGAGPDSPLLGEVLEPDTWGWPEDPSDPTVRLVVMWGALFPNEEPLSELRAIASFAEQNEDVSALAADVGLRKAGWPEGIELPHVATGPLPMQSLRLVAVPSVLVLDKEYRLRSVISPYAADESADLKLVEAVEAVRDEASLSR